VEFAVAVRSALRVARECRACRLPTPDGWQPRHVSYCYSFQPPARLSYFSPVHPLPFVISTNHLDHFPFHRCLHHSYLLFSSRLIIPYWLVTFVHVHCSVHPPELSLSLSTNRHWRNLRLFVILLLLALPCLNSLTRCVITCPIWFSNPRQQGLEVFMNLCALARKLPQF